MNKMLDPPKRVRILIVDDHPLVREGLTTRISSQPDLEVCGEAEDVEDGLLQFKACEPDLALVDISLKKGHGLELIKQIKTLNPEAKMLVISAYEESFYAERALRAGALGYISKQECRENVVGAIRTVLEGRRYLSPQMTDQLLGMAVTGREPTPLSPVEKLTDRELQVYQLIGQAQTTSSIAKQLHLSPHTIDSHREKIKAKLGLKNGAELTRHALQWVLENR
ncbi:MAG TPA: response regulator transcription factor [Pirellulales bacterium]|jgi:DNA-binding NarL/FixJ family response regulator|nr:response regulator transcription factor [Pirellulales bacterium]